MQRFLKQAALFAIPWLLYACFIVAVDPFERFGVVHAIPASSKQRVAPIYNNALWKAIQFDRAPGPNITLGASGMNHISPELIKDVSGAEYRNLTVNGASLSDVINAFWFATHRVALKHVAVGLNVAMFNRSTNRDTVSGALATERNPLAYLTNRDVLGAAANLVSATYLGGQLKTDAPPMDKDAFWKDQIQYGAARNFYSYVFDDHAYEQLGEISRYCHQHDIALTFLILPVHADVHDRIRTFGVEDSWRQLRGKLEVLGETFDFDVDDELTRDRERFTDPFHFDAVFARMIVERAFPRGENAHLIPPVENKNR